MAGLHLYRFCFKCLIVIAVIGGCDSVRCVETAEMNDVVEGIYFPATKLVTSGAKLSQPRILLTSVVIENRFYFIAGIQQVLFSMIVELFLFFFFIIFCSLFEVDV